MVTTLLLHTELVPELFLLKSQHSLAAPASLPQRGGSGRILWCSSVEWNKVQAMAPKAL